MSLALFVQASSPEDVDATRKAEAGVGGIRVEGELLEGGAGGRGHGQFMHRATV